MKLKTRFVITICCIVFIGLSLIPTISNYQFSFAIRKAFQLVCHGEKERCFIINNQPMALCVRCVSIYFFLGLSALILSCSNKKSIFFLVAALFLIVIDVLLEFLQVYQNIFFTRILTGGFLGFSIANILVKKH